MDKPHGRSSAIIDVQRLSAATFAKHDDDKEEVEDDTEITGTDVLLFKMNSNAVPCRRIPAPSL